MNYERPVREGQTVKGRIIAKGEEGDGILKVDNFVVFVPNTCMGEEVVAQVTQVGKHFALAIKIDGNEGNQ